LVNLGPPATEQSLSFRSKAVSVLRIAEVKTGAVITSLPILVFGSTPRDLVVSGLLAELAQSPQAIDHC
jgi:hypothetical protein